ncbi:MAG: vitamin K epoxide reductase family protein [Rhodoglobus sp.]
MSKTAPARRSLSLAVILIVTGAIGWYGAFRLTLDKIKVLENPKVELECNLSVIVSCGANLDSWQGAILGFPNPILGLAGFVAPIAVGFALLAGASFARWFWIAFATGVAGAFVFCLWLAYHSIFVISTLCPWCMLVWSATIPMFWALTFHLARVGLLGSRARPLGTALYSWVPAITLASYLVIAATAQWRLDVLSTL